MSDEYVLLHINDDDPEMDGPMFLLEPGMGLTYKLDEAARMSREQAKAAIREMDGNSDGPREAGVCFAVPSGYKK